MTEESSDPSGHEWSRGGLTPLVSAGPADSDLVFLLVRRKPGAFEEVYRRYATRIWRFLERLVGVKALAEDLFQETWMAAARNAHRLRPDTQLLAWLYTIARNKHRNALRWAAFERRRNHDLQTEPSAAVNGLEQQAEARHEAARVASAFARLPEAHREVLLLCLVEGLSAQEASRILAIREDAVRKRLSRARAVLLELLSSSEKGKAP